MMISLKVHGSKVMRINTFHGDPRPSLWRRRAPCSWHNYGDSNIPQVYQVLKFTERGKMNRTPHNENERVAKLLLSKNFLALIWCLSNILVTIVTSILAITPVSTNV